MSAYVVGVDEDAAALVVSAWFGSVSDGMLAYVCVGNGSLSDHIVVSDLDLGTLASADPSYVEVPDVVAISVAGYGSVSASGIIGSDDC